MTFTTLPLELALTLKSPTLQLPLLSPAEQKHSFSSNVVANPSIIPLFPVVDVP